MQRYKHALVMLLIFLLLVGGWWWTTGTIRAASTQLPTGILVHFAANGESLATLTVEGTPGDLATGPGGQLFVRINQNHRIVRFAPSGEVLGSWQVDGEAGPITVGPEGQVFVKINNNHRVAIYSAVGEWLGEIDTGVDANDIAAAPDGTLFATFGQGNRVVHYDAEGIVLGSWDTPGTPEYVAVLGNDKVAVKINQNHLLARGQQSPWRVAIYTFAGELLSQIPLDAEPTGLAGAPDGTLFVKINNNHRILHYTVEGKLLHSWLTELAPISIAGDGEAGVWVGFVQAPPPPTASPTPTPTATTMPPTPMPMPTPALTPGAVTHFAANGDVLGTIATEGTPGDLATGPEGQLFVRINQNHRIVRYAPSGEMLGSWPVDGRAAEITVGPEGQVFVRINHNHRVVMYSATGEWLGEINTGTSANDIAAAPDGTLFATFGAQQRVVRYAPDGQTLGGWVTPGEPDRIAITGNDWVAVKINQNHLRARGTVGRAWLVALYTFDGEPVSQISLDAEPTGLAGAPDGSVFVIINNNHRVLHYDAEGTLLHSWSTAGAPGNAATDREGGVWVIVETRASGEGELQVGMDAEASHPAPLRIGDLITVTVDIRQAGGETPMEDLVFTHAVPAELLMVGEPTVVAVSGEFTPTEAGYDPEPPPNGVVQWQGTTGPNSHGRIQYRARVMGCPQTHYNEAGEPVLEMRGTLMRPNGQSQAVRAQLPVDCTPPNPQKGTFAFLKQSSVSSGQKVKVGDTIVYVLDVREISSNQVITNPNSTQLIGPITVADYLPPQIKILYQNGQPRIADWVLQPTGLTFNRTVWPPRIVGWQAFVTPGAYLRYMYEAQVVACPPADAQGRHIIRNTAKLGLPSGQVLTATAEVEVECPASSTPNVNLNKRVRIPRLQTGPKRQSTTTEAEVIDFTPDAPPVFEFELSNNDEMTYTIVVTDTLPEGLLATDVTVEVGEARILDDGRTIVWEVTSEPGSRHSMVAYTRPSTALLCARELLNQAKWATQLPDGSNYVNFSNPVRVRLTCEDLGDAPDSTNHAGKAMEAYPGVTAHFPTIFDPALGGPQGPRHNLAWKDSWLGRAVSSERDADKTPDEDGVTNLDGATGQANHDGWDDGLFLNGMPEHCTPTTAIVVVTVKGQEATRYLNLWFDWNRDGDWGDVLECPSDVGAITAPEWAVRNYAVTLGPGVHRLTLPAFLAFNPQGDSAMWVRLTLSDTPAPLDPATGRADGRGPARGYTYGETEDYLIGNIKGPDLEIRERALKITRRVKRDPVSGMMQEYLMATSSIEYSNIGNGPSSTITITSRAQGVPDGQTLGPPVNWFLRTGPMTWSERAMKAGEKRKVSWSATFPFTTSIGTVFTHTLVITTTGDVDLSNNTSVMTFAVPVLPPQIDSPPAGTTCNNTITLTGRAQPGVFVDIYANGVYTATTVVGKNLRWGIPLTLSDGTYTFYAKARTSSGKESPPSAPLKMIVRSGLLWDPITLYVSQSFSTSGQFWTENFPVKNDQGRMDPGNLRLHLKDRSDTITMGIEVKTCGKKRVDSVVLKIDGQPARTLKRAYANMYYLDFRISRQDIVKMKGKKVQLCFTSGGVQQCTDGKVTIDPEGYVFDLERNALVEGAKVTALQSGGEAGFIPWDATAYNQVNPQQTGSDGYFSFYTPPGTYRVQVTKAGYQPYLSPNLTVVTRPVRYDVPLTPLIADTPVITITVDEQGFHPAVATVPPGSVVAWVNGSTAFHGSMSVAPPVRCQVCPARAESASGWDSGLLAPGAVYRWRVSGTGTYTYTNPTNPLHTGMLIVAPRRRVYVPLLLR